MDANEFNKLSDCFFFRVTDLNLAGQNFVAASVRNGEWEWLVEFDGNVVLDLHTLGPFLDKYSSKPLLLLDWSYHEDCGDDGFQCFSHELHNMLHARRKYIEDSKENVEAWLLGERTEIKQAAGAIQFLPDYFSFWLCLRTHIRERKLAKEHDGSDGTRTGKWCGDVVKESQNHTCGFS